ncbi:hypothetical protein [Sphingobium bisphenolivorans]|uniref:hypothetical protein n=1 Tax=Sphingobium bisphenolivorans TaxID=1335760 RepID=UPI0003A81C42|nr:hypothetical protein [Sphingobium bisphenolivorans]
MATGILLALLSAACVIATYYAYEVRRLRAINSLPIDPEIKQIHITSNRSNDLNSPSAIIVSDDHGNILLKAEEVSTLPFSIHKVENAEKNIGRLGQMATDLLSGSARLPGKTIRLVFSPEVTRGLKDGTYTLMTTKSGEVLADAVKALPNGLKPVVEKGRLVQSGQVAQLAGGAFMLVSIAVSQAHLADIERSLGGIRKSISDLRDHIENQDRADIVGSLNYLQDMLAHLQNLSDPSMISSEKSHALESLMRESFVWLDLVQSDMESLVKNISAIESKDKIGTKYTYTVIKDHVARSWPLIARYEMYLQLSAAAHVIVTYLDPTAAKFTRPKGGTEDWLRVVDRFRDEITSKTQSLIGSSIANSDELISFRNSEINRLAHESHFSAYSIVNDYKHLISKLDDFVHGLMTKSGQVQLALRYDDEGKVEEAAFLT